MSRALYARRFASLVVACVSWGLIVWWAVASASLHDRLGHKSHKPSQLILCLGLLPLLWSWGPDVFYRTLRVIPRTLYSLECDTWWIWTIDIMIRAASRVTVSMMTILLFDVMLWKLPQDFELQLPSTFAQQVELAESLGAEEVRDMLCKFLSRTMRALVLSQIFLTMATLLDPPDSGGSNAFRLVPIKLRGSSNNPALNGFRGAPSTLKLFCHGEEIPMPKPEFGKDGILFWTFEETTTIDEYSWVTSESAPPDDDPIEWCFQGAAKHASDKGITWHFIHHTSIEWDPCVAPQERGAQCTRRFIAPNGAVPASQKGWLGSYYRALQNPRRYRDQFAVALLLRKLLYPIFLSLALIPWLAVFGLEFATILGMTSISGLALGAVLSLARSEIVENLVAGAILSAQGNLIQGDEIELLYQVGNAQMSLSGVVCGIGVAYLALEDKDGLLVQIPNRRVLGSILRTTANLAEPGLPARRSGSHTLDYLSRAVDP